MFIAQAHSFAQQARLAVTLAWIAGYTNILTVLTCGTVSSHISGTTSNLGREVVEGKWGLAAFAFVILISFFLGAFISGLATETGRRRGWESIYVLPMLMEAALLFVFGLGLEMMGGDFGGSNGWIFFMTAAASMAMGVQNATITRISNGVIRTTHVTGVITDLGLEAAHTWFWFRDRQKRQSLALSSVRVVKNLHRSPGAKRLVLLIAIWGLFALGSAMGTLAYLFVDRYSMVPPVLLLGWIVLMDLIRPIAELEESQHIKNLPDGEPIPPGIAVYHLRKTQRGLNRLHHMPNLIAWAERLPARVRVVILDMGHEARLNSNAALDLAAVHKLLDSQNRRLILAGLNEEEFARLRNAGLERLSQRDVTEGMEEALHRAVALLGASPGSSTSVNKERAY